jgi:hypothetical protein
MSTAVALTASSIRTIQKNKMLLMLRKEKTTSNALVAYLLSSVKNYRDHVAHLLTFSAEHRVARVLLRMAHLNGNGRDHAPTSQSVHESIPEEGIHKLRWGT